MRTLPDARALPTRLRRAGTLCAFAMVLLGIADVLGFLCSRYVRVNLSPSLPLGLYRPVPLPLARSRLVSACLPPAIARLGRARSYLPPGSCPGDAAPVLKILAAVPGDFVEVNPLGIAVNGVPLTHSAACLRDSHGRSLVAVPAGHYRLRDCYWLAAPHAQSWDSRYFGCVPRESLREVLVPGVTASPPQPVGEFCARKSGPSGRQDRQEVDRTIGHADGKASNIRYGG
jgi:conjugative transfer signal peptidase TraF